MKKEKDNDNLFVSYEYKQIEADVNNISIMIDGYENFGWVVDENINFNEGAYSKKPNNKAILRLKRDRKIINKMELTILQRNFEFCLKEINSLEKSKTSKATIYALIAGIIGTAFMAGSVFAVTAKPAKIVLCIILAIPAFIGWITPYFLYKNTVSKREKAVNPLIEEKQEEIFKICEMGSRLLN